MFKNTKTWYEVFQKPWRIKSFYFNKVKNKRLNRGFKISLWLLTDWSYRADLYNSFLVGQKLCVHLWELIGKRCLWVRLDVTSSAHHVLFAPLGWFVIWEVSGHIASFLGVVSRICSKQLAEFLCSSHLVFSSSVILESTWCNHTVVPIRLKLGRNRILLFSKGSDFNIIDNLLTEVHAFHMRMQRLINFSKWDIAAEVNELFY